VAARTWPLVAATGLHAGFQATVTALVYPALARVRDHDFPAAHDAHSRRITPLVALVYGSVVVACAGALRSGPRSAGVRVAALGSAGAVLVTAAVAAPTHGRLGRGRTPELVARLLRADQARLACAVVAFAGAMGAAAAQARRATPAASDAARRSGEASSHRV
jgi:hypothetical protein